MLLRQGTRDFPRMIKILDSQRVRGDVVRRTYLTYVRAHQVFLLVNEATVSKYKADLADEIEPSITELMERAEGGLKELYKQENSLQKKVWCFIFFELTMDSFWFFIG